MENSDLIQLWKQYDEKLERSLSLNHKIIMELQQQKAKNALKPARNYKFLVVFLGVIYSASVAYFLYHLSTYASIFINLSVGIHLLIILIAIGMYIRQLVLISEIDRSENIVQMQQKMAKLQSSTLKVVGICFLQFPVFATWSIRLELVEKNPFAFWLVQVPVIAGLTYIGVWFFMNINIKNMNKRWFRMMFYGVEWSSIIRSGKFLKEIESFERN